MFSKDNIVESENYDLFDNGLQTFKNILSPDEVNMLLKKSHKNDYKYIKEYIIQNKKIKKIYKKLLGDKYEFQDYIFIIKKSSIHTCHRDGNGDFFNTSQKYPSYTMILYLEDMEKSLGVIPDSHKNINSFGINLINPVINLSCKKGDLLIFNANLLHVGTINNKDDHFRIQMKITHTDDFQAISFYENYHKILDEENKLPKSIRIFQRNLSCLIPFISNFGQSQIQTTTQNKNNNFMKNAYSYLCYGNDKVFDLPDIIV
jgi:ectoine hydroxylase-related dioxygenase (phytanoyl-CoA dioxygenase family)